MNEDDFFKRLSLMSKDELIQECYHWWIECQAQKDYFDDMNKEAGKCIDMERDEKKFWENRFYDEQNR